jgi:hypothetical protein
MLVYSVIPDLMQTNLYFAQWICKKLVLQIEEITTFPKEKNIVGSYQLELIENQSLQLFKWPNTG